MDFKHKVKAVMEANKQCGFAPVIPVGTLWEVEHWRQGDNGLYLLNKTRQGNTITTEGFNAWLDIMFHGSTQITTWYIAIFEDDYTPLEADTYAVPGYTECTAYTEAARQEYVEAAASAKNTTNVASKATFTLNASKTIYGGALVGGGTDPTDNTDTAGGGTLLCASKFSSAFVGVSTDILQVTCSITMANVA